MPKIIINEKENEVMRLLNPTENVALVPLVCKAGTDTKAKIYRTDDILLFKSDFKDKVVTEIDGVVTFAEKSFMYAYMLLTYGLSIVIKPIVLEASLEGPFEEKAIVDFVNNAIIGGAFAEFADKNIFNLKFITTGAHANILTEETSEGHDLVGCYREIAEIAQNRGDCVALMELEDDVTCEPNTSNPRDIKNILVAPAGPEADECFKFAACVFPAGEYSVTDGTTKFASLKMPGSFGYLGAFGNSTQTNADYFAAAGVTRGAIPNLNNLTCEIGESQMHIMLNENETGAKLKFNVNPIMNVSEYGSKIWGNKVALVNLTSKSYQSYLNVRLLLCNIKKQIYYAATRVTFEPNDVITWLNFTNLANELLDDMQANRGLEWYSWRRQATKEKATIKAILTLKPIEAVEYFDITVSLTSEEAEVTEI